MKIGTFNLKNLFNRYVLLDEPWENRGYEKLVMAIDVVSIASRQGDLVSYETTLIQRNNTALAILEAEPDILTVQEVENLTTLRVFNDKYLDDYFGEIILVDGNDPRGIDVGLMVKRDVKNLRIESIRTHFDETKPGAESVNRGAARNFGYLAYGALFSRDCLEVDINYNGSMYTFLVNHLKAQGGNNHVERRKSQADRVAEIVNEVVGRGRIPIVLGDLNVSSQKDGSLESLINHDELDDPFTDEDWTHYYSPSKSVSRLDYILLHKPCEIKDKGIVKKGLTTKCKQYTGSRFPTVGPVDTEASDHCLVWVDLK
jgi:endonuclease/exonuclease/phosphatase family metal-dependent hydrolase